MRLSHPTGTKGAPEPGGRAEAGVYELPLEQPAPVVLVTAVGEAAGSRAAAAALACAGSEPDRAGLLIDLAKGRPPRPLPVATAGARALEERLAAHLSNASVASRGAICHLSTVPPAPVGGVATAVGKAESDTDTDTDAEPLLDLIAAATPLARDSVAVVHLPPHLLQPALDDPRIRPTAALLRADLPADRPLTALAARDLVARGLRLTVLKQPLGWMAGRLALFGALPVAAFPAGVAGGMAGVATRVLGIDDNKPRHCYDRKDEPEHGPKETSAERSRP